MTVPRDPIRLRELDPLFDRAVEQAHGQLPSATSIEAMVRAVEQATSAHAAASSSSVVASPPPALPYAATPGVLAGVKSAALKLTVVAAMSSGLWWAVRMPTRAPAAPSPAAPSRVPAASAPSPSEPLAPKPDAYAAPLHAAPPPHRAPRVAPTTPQLKKNDQPRSEEEHRARPSARPASASKAARRAANAPAASLESGRTDDFEWQPNPDAKRPTVERPRGSDDTRHTPIEADDPGDVPPSELELLEEAQRALRTSPKDALTLTEQHRFEYPRGQFAQEREQIAIEALFSAGRLPAMRERAREFRRNYPRSAHTARILELLEAAR